MIACPTPEKTGRYATREGAESAARRAQIGVGKHLYPYPCACTWWHLSHTKTAAPLPNTPANPIDVTRLRTIPDITFRGIVAADATGKAPTPDRLALRHPHNHKRWARILSELITDIHQQRKDRKDDQTLSAHDWRKRSTAYEAALQVLVAECRQLQSDAKVKALQDAEAAQADSEARAAAEAEHKAKQAAKAQQAANERIAKASQKELRRLAGEAAINRLIDAHGPEWCQLLAEECDRIGAEPPNRVVKYLRTEPQPAQEYAA
ncbi:hypothetical protein [[Kitasatospora] papulosa]|uniref:hypothetical protein n=1 Tax=[Kitasatospora] papulosa TaxID=1464011 RepID=UPI003626886A